MEAYFRGKKELFQGLEIERLEKEWTEYPVLRLDLNTAKYDKPESLTSILNHTLRTWEDIYGKEADEDTLALRFAGIIRRAYEQTGKQVVILIDEYDKPLLQAITDKALQDNYRRALKAFYGCLKTQDRYIRFALLTGVTKFGQVSVFSDLNNLEDISLSDKFQAICGITEEELHANFKDYITALAKANRLSYDECAEKLRQRYDGYHFTEQGIGIYNPFSILNTFKARKFSDYWFQTGTPTFLIELLKADDFYLPDLTRKQVSADLLGNIGNIEDSPVAVLYQAGYLTIKDYDPEFCLYTVGFPNAEVEQGFMNCLLPAYTQVKREDGAEGIKNFILDLRAGRPEAFMQRMQAFLSFTNYQVVGKAEKYFQNAFYIVARLLGFYAEVERTIADGRIDMLIKTKNYIYIFEFKYNESADTALAQIEEKQYAAPLPP